MEYLTINAYGESVNIRLREGEYQTQRRILLSKDQPDPPKRIAIIADTNLGERYGTVTVNLPDEELGPDEFFVKTYSKNAWVTQLIAAQIITPTGRTVSTGYVSVLVCKRGPNYEKVTDVRR